MRSLDRPVATLSPRSSFMQSKTPGPTCMHRLHACGTVRGMPLELRHMRHVIALAEHGSFARAATALGLSQSALSRSIQSVEREVGSSLFVRTANGVEPTDSGRVFVARIRQIAEAHRGPRPGHGERAGPAERSPARRCRPVSRPVRARRRARTVRRRLPARRRARDDARLGRTAAPAAGARDRVLRRGIQHVRQRERPRDRATRTRTRPSSLRAAGIRWRAAAHWASRTASPIPMYR